MDGCGKQGIELTLTSAHLCVPKVYFGKFPISLLRVIANTETLDDVSNPFVFKRIDFAICPFRFVRTQRCRGFWFVLMTSGSQSACDCRC